MNDEQEDKNELSGQYEGSSDDSSKQLDTGKQAAPLAGAEFAEKNILSGHIPPPFTIEDGSVTIRCDRAIADQAKVGTDIRPNRYKPDSLILSEIKILDDAGNVIYLNQHAENCEVLIWIKLRTDTSAALEPNADIVVRSDSLIEAKHEFEVDDNTGTGLRRFKRKAKLTTDPNIYIANIRVRRIGGDSPLTLFEDGHRSPKDHAYRVMIWQPR
jgi:hypothetical protein